MQTLSEKRPTILCIFTIIRVVSVSLKSHLESQEKMHRTGIELTIWQPSAPHSYRAALWNICADTYYTGHFLMAHETDLHLYIYIYIYFTIFVVPLPSSV